MLIEAFQQSFIAIFITTLNIRYYFISLRLLIIDCLFFASDVLVIIPNVLTWYRTAHQPIEYTYGEVSYWGINKALNEIPKEKLNSFIDLGSGKGKIVFFTSLVLNLRSTGVEISPKLIQLGKLLKQCFFVKNASFINEDITNFELPDVDVYFFAGTCFSDQTLNYIKQQLSLKNHHFYILSTSKPFVEECYDIVNFFYVPCTWGSTTLYLQENRPEVGS